MKRIPPAGTADTEGRLGSLPQSLQLQTAAARHRLEQALLPAEDTDADTEASVQHIATVVTVSLAIIRIVNGIAVIKIMFKKVGTCISVLFVFDKKYTGEETIYNNKYRLFS